MKVGILYVSGFIDDTQSVFNVIDNQIKMLLDAGISVKFLINENCNMERAFGAFLDKRLELCCFNNKLNGNDIVLKNYKYPDMTGLHDTFHDEADVISQDLAAKLSDVDVCILHDIFYQGRLLVHNVAIRKVQEMLPDLRFIAFTHSIPYGKPRGSDWPYSAYCTPMPSTKYVALSRSGVNAVANYYGVKESDVSIVNNGIDILDYVCPEVKDIASGSDFVSSDILIVYPSRMMKAKRFQDVASFAGSLKSIGIRSVKAVFCDAPSHEIFNTNDVEYYKGFIRETGINFGLAETDMIFTSDFGYKNGLPHQAVLDLFSLSNLFVFPSITEAFSLIILEAASRGNFLVLNRNVPVFQELSVKMNAHLMRWDEAYADYVMSSKPSVRAKVFLEDNARIVYEKMNQEHVLQTRAFVRQRCSPKWIWENQMKQLLLN